MRITVITFSHLRVEQNDLVAKRPEKGRKTEMVKNSERYKDEGQERWSSPRSSYLSLSPVSFKALLFVFART